MGGWVIEIDTVDGLWYRSEALVDGVAVVPRDHGEFTVFMQLPDLMPEGHPIKVVDTVVEGLSEPNCCASPAKALEFYRRVLGAVVAAGGK